MAEVKSQEEMGFTGDRVRESTERSVNQTIDERQMQADVRQAARESAEQIERRIRSLESEWDIERALEMNAATLAMIGIFLAATGSKRWLALPMVVTGFLLQHAIEGWCPPLPALRRLGFRTQREIEAEKYALKALQKMRTAR